MSSENWKKAVTEQRGDYSRRLKSAHPINGSGCSSWPTSSTKDHKGGYNGGRIRNGKVSMDTLDVAVQAVESGLAAQANPSTNGNRQELWPTPAASTGNGGAHGLGGGSGANQTLKRFNVPEMGTGKLNPRWVETLMGLPVGWTMPSCACPVTIAPTSCDSSATESSQPPQNELFGS